MWLSLLDLMRQTGAAAFPELPAVAPEWEWQDDGTHLRLRVTLAGVDPKSVQVQVRETSLAIGGRSTLEERTEGPNFARMQSAVSQFFREVPLTARVDPHRSVARWEADGALVVTMPKR